MSEFPSVTETVLIGIEELAGLRTENERLRAEQERCFQILEAGGVPRNRAKSIDNGINVLATRHDRAIDDREQQLAALRRPVVRLEHVQSQLADCQAANIDLRGQVDNLKLEIEELRRPLAEIRKEAEGEEGIEPQQMLNYLCRRIDALQKTTRKLQPENERMRRELRERVEMLEAAQGEIEDLKQAEAADIDRMERAAEALEQQTRLVAEVTAELAAKDAEIERLQAERDRYRNEWMALSQDDGKLEREVERLKGQLRERVERLEAAQGEIHELRCPADCEGDRNPCSVCGTPVRYGERHTKCGQSVMTLEKEIARLSSMDTYIVQGFWSPCRKYIANVHISHSQITVQDDNGDVWEPTGPAQDMAKVTA